MSIGKETHPNKNRNFFYIYLFLKTKKLILFSFKNDVTCCVNKIYKITYPWDLN